MLEVDIMFLYQEMSVTMVLDMFRLMQIKVGVLSVIKTQENNAKNAEFVFITIEEPIVLKPITQNLIKICKLFVFPLYNYMYYNVFSQYP